MNKLSLTQKRFLTDIAELNTDIKCFTDLSAEVQIALMYMNSRITFYDELQSEVNEFLKLIDLEKQAEQLWKTKKRS